MAPRDDIWPTDVAPVLDVEELMVPEPVEEVLDEVVSEPVLLVVALSPPQPA